MYVLTRITIAVNQYDAIRIIMHSDYSNFNSIQAFILSIIFLTHETQNPCHFIGVFFSTAS